MKYVYLYLGIALMFLSTFYVDVDIVELLLMIISITFLIVLTFDIYKQNIVYVIPKVSSTLLDVLVLIVAVYALLDIVKWTNVFMIILILSFLIKMFFSVKK